MKKIINNLVLEHHSRNPYTIAKQLGIIVLEEELGSINGYYNEVMGYKFIHVNSELPDYHKRFVVAHELGHALLHPNFNYCFLKNHTLLNIDRYEKEANIFAIELICDENVKDCETISDICKVYGIDEKLLYKIGVDNNGFSQCSQAW